MLKLNRRAMIALAAAATAAMTPALAQEAATEAPGDFSLGSPDAPVKVVEYASFTCPHCATFHANVFKKLKTDYIDTGKVHFTLREVYFDRYGLWAAMVARCGGDMRYFGIHDMLFDQQQDWATASDPTIAVQKLRTIGLSATVKPIDEMAAQSVAWLSTAEEDDAGQDDPAAIAELVFAPRLVLRKSVAQGFVPGPAA